jgi:hypothetical protein
MTFWGTLLSFFHSFFSLVCMVKLNGMIFRAAALLLFVLDLYFGIPPLLVVRGPSGWEPLET